MMSISGGLRPHCTSFFFEVVTWMSRPIARIEAGLTHCFLLTLPTENQDPVQKLTSTKSIGYDDSE
jgi:hypothetical protein